MDLEKPIPEATPSVSTSPIENGLEQPSVQKNNNTFMAIVIILLLLVLGVGASYVYTTYIAPQEVEQEDSEEYEEEEITEEQPEEESEEIDNKEYVMKNKGWALYSYPDYEFTAEISPYTMSEIIGAYKPTWNWTVQTHTRVDNLYPDYQRGISIKFFPDAEDAFGCGEGCAKEHWFLISIYENRGSKSLTEVKNTYFANVKKNGESDSFIPTITEKQDKKWGHDVIVYTQTTPSDMGTLENYMVVTTKFVYVIEKFQNESPAESYQESQKILESFTFGE